jgi:ribosomal protein L40E
VNLSENGNGEVKELLEIKRRYHKNAAELEAKLLADFERDLTDGKKQLRERYLEQVVDVIFAETPPQKSPVVEEKKPEPVEAVPGAKVCSECGARLDEGAKFCGQCATPVEEEALKDVTKVASAGRKRSIRVR